jgi:beta-mannanase
MAAHDTGPLPELATIPTASPAAVALGVYQHGVPWGMSALAEFERQAERPVAIVMWYQDWAHTAELDLGLFARVAQHGAVPLLTWEPWDHTAGPVQPAFHLARVLAGDFDAYLGACAQRLARYGAPVMLRWAHEMNGHWYPWSVGAVGRTPGQNTPDQYVAAWQHIWRLFRAEGADNVAWVWSPNVLDHCAAFESCYPGHEFVDWLALDGYNWGGWGRWRSFARLFGDSYKRLAALGPQPLMIAETASAEAGGSKARWIRDALTESIPTRFPRVRAVVWFNQRKERDWRIESSPASRRAFAEAVAAPPYRAYEA